MDDTRFDTVARMLVTRDSRRALFGVLAAGGAATALTGSALGKKKKKKKRCLAPGKGCSSDGRCCSKNCCGGECMFNGRICCTGLTGAEYFCFSDQACCDRQTSNFDQGCTFAGFPVCCAAPEGSQSPLIGWPAGTICCDSPEHGEDGACPSAEPNCVVGGGCTA